MFNAQSKRIGNWMLRTITALVAACCLSQMAVAQTAPTYVQLPQNNWFLESLMGIPGAAFNSLTRNSSGNVIVIDNNNGGPKAEVYSPDGALLGTFPCGRYIYALQSGNYLCADYTSANIVDSSGNILQSLNFGQNGPASASGIQALGQMANGEIVVGSRTYTYIFSATGTYVRQWGGVANEFAGLVNNLSTVGNIIYTIDGYSNLTGRDEYGSIVVQPSLQAQIDGFAGFGAADGNLIVVNRNYGNTSYVNAIEFNRANVVTGLVTTPGYSFQHLDMITLGAGANDVFYGIGYDPITGGGNGKIYKYRKAYRTADTLAGISSPAPEPIVLSVTPQSGTAITNIAYQVYDVGAASVTTAALAFMNGTRSLANAIRLVTFSGGTAANIGPNIPTGTQETISWNAGADLSGQNGFVPATVSVFAQDTARPALIDLHFITIPANVPTSAFTTALTISDTPIRQIDMLEAWFWLVATNDPSITFANGQVTAASGSGTYAGQQLASGTTTTAAGVGFLLAKLGVSLASPAQIARAVSGSTNTPPPGNQYIPLKPIGPIPIAQNEIGFDTGAAGSSTSCPDYTTSCVWVTKP